MIHGLVQGLAPLPGRKVVDENTVYRLTDAAGKETVRLGSDLEDGVDVAGSGRWFVDRAR